MDLLSPASLTELAEEAKTCQRCPLFAHATQTVFGEGNIHAPLVIVGEQPGEQEDLAAHPFIGPAGRLLDRALAEAGIDRSKAYVTNAVKHFKNEPRGKKRLHKTPTAREIEICRWWLDQELALIEPDLIIALGTSAARGIGLRGVTIRELRGQIIDLGEARKGLLTVHPSFLLRLPDEEAKRREYAAFVADLTVAAKAVPAARI
ncbi:MAG TPA: UdgX family uracil-DNA binding protein [Beijerinckia sp.]|jgi:DNA polymerase|nr:UdgX family uracil-DNA binding protein [Beijerinckia sp.]